MRGLQTVPGRKTIRRIAAHVVGAPVDQSLQQFINQSTWDWNPVRKALAHLAGAMRPQAWTVQEAVFPKNGNSSVGVARQYATSTGRILNCQLGLAVILAGREHGCAVNWRLMLPSSWDDDRELRARTRVPDGERHLPHWEHVLRAIDETAGWGIRPAPVVLEVAENEVQQVLPGLSARGLPYVVRIPGQTPILRASAYGRVLTVGELAARSVKRHVLLPPADRLDGRPATLQYSVATVCDACLTRGSVPIASACPHVRSRRLLAEWMPGGGRLRAAWLTNLRAACLHELVGLVTVGARARHQVMTALRGAFGLQDFEGRSYAGWQHHVTLVSAAHAHWTLRRAIPNLSTVDGRDRSLRQA